MDKRLQLLVLLLSFQAGIELSERDLSRANIIKALGEVILENGVINPLELGKYAKIEVTLNLEKLKTLLKEQSSK